MKKVAFYFIAAWLALLPWHAFLKTWLSSLFLGSHADFLPITSNILSLWKEIILFISLIVIIWWSRKKLPSLNYTNGIFYSVLAYVLSVLIFGGIQANSISALLLGIRTDLLFIPTLLLGFLLPFVFDKKRVQQLLRVTLLSLTVTFGLFMCLWILAPDFSLHFGYSPYESSYVDTKPLPVYHCLFVEDSCIPRLQGSFSGPNQAGSLAILWGGLLFYMLNNYWHLILPFLALILTFSRSAFLGGLLAIVIQLPKKILGVACSIGTILIITVFVLAPDFVTHGLSSSEHWHKTIDGIQRITNNPFGTGLGSAGPVSRRILGESNALISENWYLQIGEEAGIIALILLLLFTTLVITQLLRSTNRLSKTMGAVLLGASFQALFLHLWEDSVVTILIWFWIGISLCYNSLESTKTYGK